MPSPSGAPPLAPPLLLPVLDDYAELMNSLPGGWVQCLGLTFTAATATEVRATMVVTDTQVQPYGITHGGVYCSVVESVASVGAALEWLPQGHWVVGISNQTRFVRPSRPGTRLDAVGRPGPKSGDDNAPCWRVDLHNDAGQLVASGEVLLRALPPGTSLSGRAVGLAEAGGVTGIPSGDTGS